MLIRLAIADSDQEYLARLSNVMGEYEDVSLSIYTDRRSLEEALQSKRFDVLLFDSDIFEGQISVGKKTVAVMLLDEEKFIPESLQNYHKIKKYQRISRIYSQILELYADVSPKVSGVVGEHEARSIGFYSPAGGCGKTTLALVTAAKLAARGYKTFYLNMEDIASEECYLPQTGEKGMSELVSMLGSNINFPMKLQSLLQTKTDNFYYMKHFDSPNDVYEMTEQEIEELFEEIEKAGFFDFVVVDMGVSLDSRMLCLFERLHKIVLVEKPDRIAELKLSCFLGQAHITSEYGYKMVRLLNFDDGRGGLADESVPLIGRIGTMQNPDSGQLIGALANHSGLNYTDALLA